MSQYSFADTLVNSKDNQAQPIERITFGSFDSAEKGWWLMDRSAPTPSEKEITETIPYSQGILDFSTLGIDRFFDNRDITYQFKNIGNRYDERKVIENEIKRMLMPLGTQALFDSHEPGLHWLGKCKSVTVTDDANYQSLTATVIFSCYPFAIGNSAEGSDIWDDVFFPNWVFQDTSFTVNGTQSINLINIGSHTAEVKIVVTGTVSITGDFGSMTLTTGTYTDTQLTLAVGENKLTLNGSGTINFEFYKEVMI
ncbi:hypothetical protein [Liquorilactobacillus nagelii]|uniref:hypothetical protein n=1 Tax=Liquorilactobacillus nagelii TaxID=82688 RepID=UPI0006EE991F|nr:hypothetical protein [Liquorilactobacillus nagelii]KRL40737.1 hypothetical protein FD45_GL001381 [Liquorilactobacillus nagelii DSM 13675]QYH53699.1 phage tail protein [Liquorilactobacillus nagelii DSM 13675]